MITLQAPKQPKRMILVVSRFGRGRTVVRHGTGYHADRRTKRARTRSNKNRQAISEY